MLLVVVKCRVIMFNTDGCDVISLSSISDHSNVGHMTLCVSVTAGTAANVEQRSVVTGVHT